MESTGHDRLTSGVWARALDRRDPLATRLVERAVAALAAGIGSAINLLDLEAVIIGGGLGTRLGAPYAKQIERAMLPHLFVSERPPAGPPRGARRPRRRDRRGAARVTAGCCRAPADLARGCPAAHGGNPASAISTSVTRPFGVSHAFVVSFSEMEKDEASSGADRLDRPQAAESRAVVRTFLIADVRGYTSFTQTRGDEAAGELAAKFAALAREAVTATGGEVIELRGDEALWSSLPRGRRFDRPSSCRVAFGSESTVSRSSRSGSGSVSLPARRFLSKAATAAAP
jgi:Transcriptional regulator/sugar kinase